MHKPAFLSILWGNSPIMMDYQPLTRLTTAFCINKELPEGSKPWPFGDSGPTHLSLPKRYMWRPGFCGNKGYELHLFWMTCSSRNLIILTPLFNLGSKFIIALWFYTEIVLNPPVCVRVRLRSCVSFPQKQSWQLSHRIARSCSFPLPLQFLHHDWCHRPIQATVG